MYPAIYDFLTIGLYLFKADSKLFVLSALNDKTTNPNIHWCIKNKF